MILRNCRSATRMPAALARVAVLPARDVALRVIKMGQAARSDDA
jgi:hypothetical protein